MADHSIIGSDDEESRLALSMQLLEAVKGNEQWLIGAALDRGADVDFWSRAEPRELRTPLRLACAAANVQVIRILLSRGASVFAGFDLDRWSALHAAAEAGHDKVVRLLLAEAEELHEGACSPDGFSLLHVLVECMNTQLFDDGVDIFAFALKERPAVHVDSLSFRPGYADWTPLHAVCARGSVRAAISALKAGAKLDARTGEFFVGSGQVFSFASSALSQGPQVASVEHCVEQLGVEWFDKGLLPIHLAALGGHLHMVNFLLKRGQGVNTPTTRHQWTPLMFAIFSGCGPLVRELLRVGGRTVVNNVDRRGDGTEWTPLALAVSRAGPDVVRSLVTYGADPLVRLRMVDFPGSSFIRNCPPTPPTGARNRWSGPDERISLLHLAVVRGDLEVLRLVLDLMRSAHMGSPTPAPQRARGSRGGVESNRALDESFASSVPSASSGEAWAAAGALSPASAPSAARRKAPATGAAFNGPACEGPEFDPVSFCTTEGWLPAILAILLQAVDPARRVRGIGLLELLPEPLGTDSNSRAEVFVELVSCGRALLEDRPSAPPPVMPQRFADVAEDVICTAADEFVKLCSAANAERVAYRILHGTLCLASRLNRCQLVEHLLEAGICDPCCRFLRPVECRPLHIATACGFGYLAQILIEHRADPLERDEGGELPIFKLARSHDHEVSELHARIAQLEAQLQDPQLMTPSSAQGPPESRM